MKARLIVGGVLTASAIAILAGAPVSANAFADNSAPEAAADNALTPAQIAARMAAARAGGGQSAGDFAPFEKVSEGLEKVVSTADGATPFYELYVDKDKGKVLAVLPNGYESKLQMIAGTVTAGDPQAGVMGPTIYAKWKRYDKQLALYIPNLRARTDGDKQARDSVEQLFTGRILLTTPIVAMKGNRPVIDFSQVGVQQASKLFGGSAFGGYGPNLYAVNPTLKKVTKAKAFPENIVVEFEAPRPDGQLVRFAYSVGGLEGTPGFQPRVADPKIGHFYDWHADYANVANEDVFERYITRWHIEKADPSLKMSPPKEPIVWYIDHTTPVRFRQAVREGILMWNAAYEAIGIVGALEVYQQDSTTGAHMEKDPEDARYNFFRWNTSNQSYAIGPSRTNPKTGEILDADVVWHQGLTRSVRNMWTNFSEDALSANFGPEALAWFEEYPEWDPRIILAQPEQRAAMLRERALDKARAAGGEIDPALKRMGITAPAMGGDQCKIGNMMSFEIGLVDAVFAAGLLDNHEGDNAPELLDGLPADYLHQMIRYISAHEVGHCIGFAHNMAASTIRTLEEINSEGFEGPTVGSVMDYVAANINHNLGEVQGPYATPELGPYDMWAVEYAYGPADKLEEVADRVAEPDLIYQSQIATFFGSDPRNQTWDMGADNLKFAQSRLELVQDLRSKLTDKVVKDGESWAEARARYSSLLGTHVQSLLIASKYVGGSYFNNDDKGDPNARPPVEDVPAAKQRQALNMIIDNAFKDEAFGLSPELVRYFGKTWFTDPGESGITADPSFTVHDLVGSIHGTALSLIMNPTTLRRVYDNEFRTEADDAFTLAEVVDTVTESVWTETMKADGSKRYTAAKPMISSFRRNLQREHADRLITLALLDGGSPSIRTISSLAKQELARINDWAAEAADGRVDPYTKAHLNDVALRIEQAMDAEVVKFR